jgi:hypothetical protein
MYDFKRLLKAICLVQLAFTISAQEMKVNFYYGQNCSSGYDISITPELNNACRTFDLDGIGSMNIANCYAQNCVCNVYTSSDCSPPNYPFGTPQGVGEAAGLAPNDNCVSTWQTEYEFQSLSCTANNA